MQETTGACAAFLTAFLLLNPTLDPAVAQTAATPAAAPACEAPGEFTRLEHPLTRTALSLVSGDPIVIVAIGSSSTAGAGASSPAASYPSRLEADLRARFPAASITVINRGVNGEDAAQMIKRFDEMIAAERPDLVLWQVGTNAVLRDQSLDGEAPIIREGLRRLRSAQADVVIVDAQYAPKVLAKKDAPGMVDLLRTSARAAGVSVFKRWDIMRRWHDADGLKFETTLAPDGLHMNDWSYGCIAKLMAIAITDAVRSPLMARMPTRRP